MWHPRILASETGLQFEMTQQNLCASHLQNTNPSRMDKWGM
jgi:hypothetical protein